MWIMIPQTKIPMQKHVDLGGGGSAQLAKSGFFNLQSRESILGKKVIYQHKSCRAFNNLRI